MKTKFFVAAALMAALPFLAMAQNKTTAGIRAKMKKAFTLEDLIPGGSTYYRHSVPQNTYLAWWGDELVHLDLEQCWLVDKATGNKTVLFTLDRVATLLREAGMPVPRHLYSVEFPYADRPLALLQLPPQHTQDSGSTDGWRVLVDWERGCVEWRQPCEATDAVSGEDWNAQSRCLAFVKDHNLYVTDAEGDTHAVSRDGSLDLTYGESVHRDEFGIEKGTFWSPTGRLLAFYKMDQSMVSTYPQVNIKSDYVEGTPAPDGQPSSRCAVMVPDKYPMAGETSHKVWVGIYDTASGETRYLDCGDPTDRYFTNISWSPDERTLYLIELNRDQNHARLCAYDAQTGAYLSTLLEETNEKYVEPLHPIQFLPWDSSQFVYQTRNRHGYNHLYLCQLAKAGKADGKPALASIRQLTAGPFEVIDLLGFCASHRSIVYSSNEAYPIGCALYSVDMKGRRVPLGQAEGWHRGVASPSGAFVYDNWSSAKQTDYGRFISLYQVDAKKSAYAQNDDSRISLHSTLRVQEPWGEFRVPEIQVGTLKAADGTTDLYYRLVLPVDFDPDKQYPAIVYVYGGPHAHNVDASRHWGVRGWDVWMAQKGYVMFCIDNRGSEHRGLAFEQATFRQLGVEEMKDQLCGVDYLRSLPYVDAQRIGVHGWSFGGFMTTSLMTTYPDVFKVGVAGGPVIDWKYYEVMYGERYMDTPQDNPEGYAQTSLLGKAGQLQGRLLLIYGGNDPTCVPQHTLSFIRACVDAGTHPDLFTYPGDGHNMMGMDRVHLHEHISRYFDDFLR